LSPHLSVKSDYIELMYFSGAKHLKLMESDVEKKIVFEINVSHFRGREYIKGFVRDLVYDGRTGARVSESIFANSVARSCADKIGVDVVGLNTEQTKKFIVEKRKECAYGLCLIASDRRTLRFYDGLESLGCDLFYPSSKNLANALIVSPAPDADLHGFRNFVFLDTPSDFNLAALEGKQVYVNRDICGYKMFSLLDTDRASLLEIFSSLRREVGRLSGETAEELAVSCNALGFDKREFIFALRVFEELGLVAFSDGKLTVYRGVKTDLNDSPLYRKVCLLQEA